MQHVSQVCLERLTKPWEEFVAYPYDDKAAKVRGPDGKRRYPEWTGGPARGTITIGYGHTDAAGAPWIVPGMKITEAEAVAILAADMAPCERDVARLITAPLGQHQFDTLADFVFNAGAGTLEKSTLRRKLNAGDYDCVPAELMKFTLSKGEHMDGLTHRRQAEISLWKTPDDKPETAKVSPADRGVAAEDVHCPKAELPPARPALDSKTVAAGGTAIATTGSIIAAANDAAAPVEQAKENLEQLGVWDQLVALALHHPIEIAGLVVIGLLVFVVFDRWRHLHAEAH